MSERVEFHGRINVGTYGGMKVLIEATIKLKASSRETTTHKHVQSYHTLSISGSYNGGAGQIVDTLKKLDTVAIPKQDLQDLIEIWERWHLNDLRAGCVHQKPMEVSYDHPEYEHYKWLNNKRCPNGYKWGTAWLIEEIPHEVIDRVIEIFTAQPKAKSIVEEWELTLNNGRGEITVGDVQVIVDYAGKSTPRKVWGITDRQMGADDSIYQYRVTCINKGTNETASFDFFDSISNARKPTFPPDLGYSVMCCIRRDYYTTSQNYPNFESFCSEFGYDLDSRQAERTYKLSVEHGDNLSRVFDDELIETLPL